MSVDDTIVELVTDLADKVIDVDFSAPQTQSGFTAHRDDMFALSTVETSIFSVSDLLRVSTVEHLFHDFIIVGTSIMRMMSLKSLPVIMEDLFEDTPSCRCFSFHERDYKS